MTNSADCWHWRWGEGSRRSCIHLICLVKKTRHPTNNFQEIVSRITNDDMFKVSSTWTWQSKAHTLLQDALIKPSFLCDFRFYLLVIGNIHKNFSLFLYSIFIKETCLSIMFLHGQLSHTCHVCVLSVLHVYNMCILHVSGIHVLHLYFYTCNTCYWCLITVWDYLCYCCMGYLCYCCMGLPMLLLHGTTYVIDAWDYLCYCCIGLPMLLMHGTTCYWCMVLPMLLMHGTTYVIDA